MKVQTAVALTTLAMTVSACQINTVETEQVSQETFGEPLKYSKVDVNLHPLSKTVCDPFNGDPAAGLDKGIKASLFYLNAGSPRLYSSEDYVNKAQKSNQSLFLADMNVPTRLFSQGFATQVNEVVKDDNGNKLIEYFGLKFETVLKLSDTDEEGYYELALLSDDGSKLKIKTGTGDSAVTKTIIDNDGDHETRFGCSKELIYMSRDSAIPVEVTYYQGPRYHIANMLMWRKSTTVGKDSACGQSGNGRYFNADNGSQEQQAYKDLLSRGWKVVSQDNFFIPAKESYNPCVEGTNPVISNFRVLERGSETLDLAWTTDIPATSQVKLVNKATGEVILTNSDNALRTTHLVSITGLKAGTAYTAQATSISEDLGKVLSEEITVTTFGE